jgi:hypothetical protein
VLQAYVVEIWLLTGKARNDLGSCGLYPYNVICCFLTRLVISEPPMAATFALQMTLGTAETSLGGQKMVIDLQADVQQTTLARRQPDSLGQRLVFKHDMAGIGLRSAIGSGLRHFLHASMPVAMRAIGLMMALLQPGHQR